MSVIKTVSSDEIVIFEASPAEQAFEAREREHNEWLARGQLQKEAWLAGADPGQI